MPRPTHFEIPAGNPGQVMSFYGSVFGWTFQKWDGPMPYWLVTTGPDTEPGINGGILAKRDPQQPCVNTVTVADVDASIASVTAHGGRIAVPKMAVPGVGWLAYGMDPEGNMFGMMQMNPEAK